MGEARRANQRSREEWARALEKVRAERQRQAEIRAGARVVLDWMIARGRR